MANCRRVVFGELPIQEGGPQVQGGDAWPRVGVHFGSEYPCNPVHQAIYDYLPDALLERLANAAEFAGVLALDIWLGNADRRQAVFYRGRAEACFRAVWIDHGQSFGGANWDFGRIDGRCLFPRHRIYDRIVGWRSFSPWVEAIRSVSEQEIDGAFRSVWPGWLTEADPQEMSLLREQLLDRRARVPELIASLRGAAFPNWR